MNDLTDYQKYRGKCKEFSQEAVLRDPTLRLVRGFYHCPFWGEQPHWWTVRLDGSIYDPTKDQFPSKGLGNYEEFTGYLKCDQCGKVVKEEDAKFDSKYAFCSTQCNMRFVGL